MWNFYPNLAESWQARVAVAANQECCYVARKLKEKIQLKCKSAETTARSAEKGRFLELGDVIV